MRTQRKETNEHWNDLLETPDFRSVEPGSEEEVQLQRFYKIMRRNNDAFGIIERILLVEDEQDGTEPCLKN